MRKKRGLVVSSKGDKTVVVKVESYYTHSLYDKKVLRTKKFHAHDENNSCKEGDSVVIQECRPYSKLKTWIVVEE